MTRYERRRLYTALHLILR